VKEVHLVKFVSRFITILLLWTDIQILVISQIHY